MIVFLVSPYLQFYPYTSNVDLRSFISKEFYAIYSAWFNQTEIVQRNYPQNLCITPILFELTSLAELWQKIERVVQSTTEEELSNYQRRKVIVWSWTVVPTSYIFNIRADLSIFGKCGGAIKISSTSDMFKSGGRWRHFCWYPPFGSRREARKREGDWKRRWANVIYQRVGGEGGANSKKVCNKKQTTNITHTTTIVSLNWFNLHI